MAEDNQEQQAGQKEQGNERGVSGSTAVKAAAAAAATSVAAIAAKKALSHRSSNGQSSNGGSEKGDMGSMLSSALSGGWDAARDALVPAAEDAAGAAGEWLAENAPDFVRERIVPRFIESFNDASGAS